MARSFSLVDQKVSETEFFLDKLSSSTSDWFAFRCYVSAFAASARSITFALQSVLGETPRFKDWYAHRQTALREDPISRFFHAFRNVSQHVGENPVNSGLSRPGRPPAYFFMTSLDLKSVPEQDVETTCRYYFTTLLGMIYDCYSTFGPVIDPQLYFTEEHFNSQGKSIEDAEEELGFPRGWTDIGDPDALAHRWHLLRRGVGGCEIESLFDKYLDKSRPTPATPPPYVPRSSR